MSNPREINLGSVSIVKAGYAKKHRADWNKKVYHENQSDYDITPEEWRLLKYAVIKRDHRRCQRCDKRFKILELGAHHIMPRDEGGSNDMTNLMTLCNPCHDFVEINHLKTRAEIIGSYEGKKRDTAADHEPLNPTPQQADWHTWVYGGKRRQAPV